MAAEDRTMTTGTALLEWRPFTMAAEDRNCSPILKKNWNPRMAAIHRGG